jgi:thioredoxin 1
MLKHIEGKDFKKEVLENEKVVLVDFFATWCPPCKMLAPVLERVANTRAAFDIVKINIDENEEVAMQYRIEVVPTLMVFKNGKPVDKSVGYIEENEVLNLMSKYI